MCSGMVAPRVGAWIETNIGRGEWRLARSLPVWERGLKPVIWIWLVLQPPSLPVWERGLKLNKLIGICVLE